MFVDEDGTETAASGTIEGRIAHGLSGEGGFGYDLCFLPLMNSKETKSLAEVTQEEKNAISHRGNALRTLKEKLS